MKKRGNITSVLRLMEIGETQVIDGVDPHTVRVCAAAIKRKVSVRKKSGEVCRVTREG